MMKKMVCAMILLMVLVFTGSACALTLYPMTAVVTGFLPDEDAVICADFNGSEWIFEGIDDWHEGDVISMLMDSMNTEEIFDDVIVEYRYEGWIDLNQWLCH